MAFYPYIEMQQNPMTAIQSRDLSLILPSILSKSIMANAFEESA